MKCKPGESEAIKQVLCIAKEYGYGNLINHLVTAWKRKLMTELGITEELAQESALGNVKIGNLILKIGYPFKMQDDILGKGEWDHTGESYTEDK